jgi:hypothetical protein
MGLIPGVLTIEKMLRKLRWDDETFEKFCKRYRAFKDYKGDRFTREFVGLQMQFEKIWIRRVEEIGSYYDITLVVHDEVCLPFKYAILVPELDPTDSDLDNLYEEEEPNQMMVSFKDRTITSASGTHYMYKTNKLVVTPPVAMTQTDEFREYVMENYLGLDALKDEAILLSSHFSQIYELKENTAEFSHKFTFVHTGEKEFLETDDVVLRLPDRRREIQHFSFSKNWVPDRNLSDVFGNITFREMDSLALKIVKRHRVLDMKVQFYENSYIFIFLGVAKQLEFLAYRAMNAMNDEEERIKFVKEDDLTVDFTIRTNITITFKKLFFR